MSSANEDDDDIYNVDLYTDAELMEFLDMTPHSTDRELEAKIIQMMHQFPDHRAFFEDIYRRLFDLKEDDEDDGTQVSSTHEGMTGMTTTETTDTKKPGEAKNVQDKLKELIKYFEENIVQNAEKLTQAQITEDLKIAGLTPEDRARQSTVFTKALDYIKDPKNLNPTFNNTIQRVIILDSRCRDRNTNPKSTDFTLTLSEPLKNVLALNFYYINVPYTWYTVSSQYGANFFLLNGMAPGIQDVESGGNNNKYSLKFEINPGNYTTSQALVDAINASIQAVAKKRTDIFFGTSSIVLTSPTAGSGKATFTWDIQNRFGDSSYELHFPNWTSPVDWSPSPLNGGEKNSSTVASLSIPGFLGFLQPTYSLASIYSNILYTYGENMYPSPQTLFDIDAKNNKFYIYNHDSSRKLDIADPTTYYDKFEVSLNIENGSYNREDLVKNVTLAMQNHPQLNRQYSGLFYEKTSFTYPDDDSVQRFRLCVQLNRFTTKNHRNQVQTVVFPKESYADITSTGQRFPVWTGPDSALYFDDSPTITMNSTRAEIGSKELERSTNSNTSGNNNKTDIMDGYSTEAYYYYIVEDSPKMHFMCTRMPDGIADAFNVAHSFTVSVPNTGTDPGFYTLSTYLYAVNEAIRTQLPEKFTLKTTAPFYYDYYGTGMNYDSNPSTNPTFDSCIYADIGLNRNFTTSEYTVNATNSILHTTFHLPPIMNLSQQTRYTSRFTIPFNNQYRIDNTNRQITIGRLNPAPGEPEVRVFLPYAPATSSNRQQNPRDGQWYVYNGLDDLRAAIMGKSGFQQYKNDTAMYQVASDSTGTYGSARNMTDVVEPLYGLTLAGTDISFAKVNDTTAECTLTWNVFNRLTEQDYTVVLDGQSWTDNLGFKVDTPSAGLSPSFVFSEWTSVGAPVATIYASQDVATTGISIHDATIDEEQVQNNELVVRPRAGADSLSQLADQLMFSILPGYYSRFGLVRALNFAFQSNPITAGTQFMWYNGGQPSSSSSSSSSSLNLNVELENVRIDWNINKVYTAEDYSQTFWDLEKFSSVQNSYSTTENLVIRWDQTVGWLLGFRSLTSYDLLNSSATSDNFSIGYANTNAYTFDPKTDIVTLAGDIPVNINLYNQLHVILDDYTSNHMNDGIITVAAPSVNTTMQSYASRAGQRCTVVINGERVSVPGFINTDPANTDAQGRVPRLLTQAQLYSALAQNQARLDIQNAIAKTYSPPPNVKDMFALIPLKLTGLTVGQSYTEFGGTLQQNNRKYYGPVNIGRIGLKLLSDRGTLVDLNNNDWSIGIICDISIQA